MFYVIALDPNKGNCTPATPAELDTKKGNKPNQPVNSSNSCFQLRLHYLYPFGVPFIIKISSHTLSKHTAKMFNLVLLS